MARLDEIKQRVEIPSFESRKLAHEDRAFLFELVELAVPLIPDKVRLMEGLRDLTARLERDEQDYEEGLLP
jgi:hypothetical protein